MPATSIVIRAFNEERHLPALFDAIARQRTRDFETIVVDSGSTDRTREIAQARADRLVRIRPEDFTFGHSLNVGIEHAQGRHIAIVSAHTVPVDEFWLERLIAPFDDDAVAMVYGCQRGREDSKLSESLDFERSFGSRRLVLTPPHFFANNANSAVRRSLWADHRFDETLPGLEDVEWAKYWMQRDKVVVYEPGSCIYHIHTESWPQVRRRYHREAVAARRIGVKTPADVPREVMRELRSLVGDLGRGAARGILGQSVEIARFRYEKLRGTVEGILDGAPMSESVRTALFFDAPYDAVVLHGHGRATLESRPLPRLKPSEVLVRVAFEGVCATDLEILEGRLGYYQSGLASYPIVPGHEFSGVVAAVGARVTDVREGDRVVVECIQGCGTCEACERGNAIGCVERSEVGVIHRDGGYAEYMVSPSRFVHRLPDGLSLRDACLCEPLAVVLKGMRRIGAALSPDAGQRRCAVVGAGPIGHLAARVLALRDQDVTVFDREASRLARFAGSSIKIDQDASHYDQFDLMIEATGDPDGLHAMLNGSKAGASLLLLGLPYAHRSFSFESIVGYDKAVIGSVGSTADDFREAVRILPSLDVSAFFEAIMPLREFERAWKLARSRSHLKVVLQVEAPAG